MIVIVCSVLVLVILTAVICLIKKRSVNVIVLVSNDEEPVPAASSGSRPKSPLHNKVVDIPTIQNKAFEDDCTKLPL